MSNQNLNKIEKLINSELSNKIYGSEIKFEELLFKTSVSEIIEVIKFLKLDDRFKFTQLIDIAAIDYPNDEKRFELVYLLLSIENNFSSKEVFKSAIHQLKKHPGQRIVAKNIYKLLEGSEIVASHKDCDKVQDPYSFRCVPHVHGASRDCFNNVSKIIDNEINSVSDNPLVFENGYIANSGHFHAEHVSQNLDFLSISVSEIGSISERLSLIHI